MPRDGSARWGGRRARIEPERFIGGRLDRLQDFRRWRQRRLVGVELDPTLAVGRLFTRGVWLEALEGFPYDAFRHSSKNVSRASRGQFSAFEQERFQGKSRAHVLLEVAERVILGLDQPRPRSLLAAAG